MSNEKFVITTIDHLLKILELNPKVYGNLSAKEKENVEAFKHFKSIFGNKEPVTISIPTVSLKSALNAFKENDKHSYEIINDIENPDFCMIMVLKEEAEQYTSLIPSAYSKTCSSQMTELIKNDLKSSGIQFASKNNEFFVSQEDKEMLNKVFLKHEAIVHTMDDSLARVIVKQMNDRGLPCEIVGREGEQLQIQYLKANQVEVDMLIEDLQNTRAYTESDFNARFADQKCIEIQLKDDVEINKFMDLSVGMKFDYAITSDNKVRVPEIQKNVALQCKNLMLEDLYIPLNINQYEIAKADAIIQNQTVQEVSNNKGLKRYFVSSETPELYAVLDGDNGLFIKKRVEISSAHEGKYTDADLAHTHDIKDEARVGALLSYLGTPIEIPEAEFDVKKLGVMEKHPYQKEIDKAFEKHIDKSALVKDSELETLKEMFENRVNFYMHNKEEFVRDLNDAVASQQLTEKTKDTCLKMVDNYHQRYDAIEENLRTVIAFCSLDDDIAEKSKAQRQVEKEMSMTKETLFETNNKKIIEETEYTRGV